MAREYPNDADELKPNLVVRKSEQTRRRIIEATKALISQGKYTAKITDIARAAKIAQPHFYIYFSGVQDVVYAIAEEIYSANSGGFSISPEVDWRGESGFLLVRKAVEAGFAKWRENFAINSICLLLADKEEGRFRELRVRRYKFLSEIFSEKIRQAQQRGDLSLSINPELRGCQCVNIMLSMAQQFDSFIASGFSEQQIADETTRFLLNAVGIN